MIRVVGWRAEKRQGRLGEKVLGVEPPELSRRAVLHEVEEQLGAAGDAQLPFNDRVPALREQDAVVGGVQGLPQETGVSRSQAVDPAAGVQEDHPQLVVNLPLVIIDTLVYPRGEHAMSATHETPPSQDSEARARPESLVQRAQQGDEGVLPELRQVLDAHPEFWQRCGDLALQAQAAWLQLISGKDLLLREALLHKLEQVKGDLAGTGPSPLEKLLVERATVTRLQLQYADAVYAQVKANNSAQHQAIQRRQSGAQQRHLQALKVLVTMRKLVSPGQTTGEAQPPLFTPGAVG
jgi:hypothetical protein